MNRITAQARVAEAVAVTPQSKAKPATGEFRDMLSGAIKSANNKSAEPVQTAQTEAKTETKTVKSQPDTEKTVESKAAPKTQRESKANQTEISAEAAATAAAAAIQAPEAELTVEVDEPESLPVIQPVPLQMLGIQPPKTAEVQQEVTVQANEAQQDVQAVKTVQATETQADATPIAANPEQASPAKTQVVQPETPDSKQPEAPKAQPVQAHEQAVQQAETQQQQVSQVQANHANQGNAETKTITEEAAKDIISAGVVAQTDEVQEQRPVRPRPVQTTPEEHTRTRFDEMLEKASQELGQSKAAVTTENAAITTETADTPEPPVQEADVEETPVTAAETAKDSAEEPLKPEVKQETETKPQAPPVARNTTPRFEQRQEREISKTDEATLGMMQPTEPERYTHEAIRTEPQTTAQPVKVPEQVEQIRAQVIENLENDKMEFRMQLNPQELGKVDVKLILESGRFAVEIAAANPKSAELLSKQAESLIASLKLNNIEVSSVNVVTANENASGDMNSQYNLNSFQNQPGSQEQSGFARSNNGHGGQMADGSGQSLDGEAETPQRLLNYQV